MTGMTYDDAPYPVRDDLVAAHERAWTHMANAGSWLTGEQRVKVAAETRHARGCATCARIKDALSPFAVTDAHDAGTDLPANWVDMIHLIVADPGRLTRGWYDKTRATGIDEGPFVEIVSMVAHTTAIDTFAKGLGVPVRDLPAPEDSKPTGYRPAEARQHEAWVPNIAWDEFGPNEADFFVGPEANIRRALTLVPNEARGFFDLVTNQYYSREQMLDLSQEYRAISHLQTELLASRVSAINQCTY